MLTTRYCASMKRKWISGACFLALVLLMFKALTKEVIKCRNAIERLSPLADQWQPAGEDQDTYVFSAYVDRRRATPYIRIIGISSRYKTGSFPGELCVVWYNNKSIVVDAQSKVVPETHSRKFAVVMYSCPLPDSQNTPASVSLVRSMCHRPLNAIRFLNLHSTIPASDSFVLCTAPFLFNYNNFYQFVAMIESSLLLGAGHILFYNHSVGSDLRPYIESYIDQGLATVVPWNNLPVEVLVETNGQEHGECIGCPELHYFGQVAAINDCLYRNVDKAKYLVYYDMDELIVPVNAYGWMDMISSLPVSDTYIFRNSYFPTHFEDHGPYSDDLLAKKYKIDSLLKTWSDPNFFVSGERSKYIINMECLFILGIHDTYGFLDEDCRKISVDSDVGRLHHYKQVAIAKEHTSFMKYGDDLIRKVEKRHAQIKPAIL